MNSEISIGLVKHASTRHNKLRAYTAPLRQIPEDLPLDRDSGIIPEADSEIKSLVRRLEPELADVPAPLILFYSSDWKRASQTAEFTRDQINLTRAEDNQISPVIYDSRLGEQQFGMTDPYLARRDPRLASRRRNYLRATQRDALQRITRKPIHRLSHAVRLLMKEYGFDKSMQGTSLVDVSNDLSSWLADMEPKLKPGTQVVAFTHGGVIMASRMSFLGETPEELAGFITEHAHHPSACSVTEYRKEVDGWHLSAWAKTE